MPPSGPPPEELVEPLLPPEELVEPLLPPEELVEPLLPPEELVEPLLPPEELVEPELPPEELAAPPLLVELEVPPSVVGEGASALAVPPSAAFSSKPAPVEDEPHATSPAAMENEEDQRRSVFIGRAHTRTKGRVWVESAWTHQCHAEALRSRDLARDPDPWRRPSKNATPTER